jgi:hypothetical protein
MHILCLGKKEHDLMNDDFKMEELKATLVTLKARKYAGPDSIFPEFLLNMGHEAGKTFLKLANVTWKKGLPDQWRKSEVIPILKKGKPPTAAESYRPVSLTSVCCKLMARMVVERLRNHLENEGHIKEEQAGFRKYRSTMDQVTKFTQAVKDGFHRKMSMAAVLVDFKAAYDRVWWQMLIYKTQGSVRGRMLLWIKSFLAQRYIRVRLRHVSSRYKQQRQGLPQGAVLSCLLFNIMINDQIDAVQFIPGVSALLYADDLLIWATSGDPKCLEEPLREALQHVHLWADLNQMTVSAEKTVYQLFTLSARRYHLDLFLNGYQIAEENLSRYLGVRLDSKLTFAKHVRKCAADKGQKRVRLLKRLTATKCGARQDIVSTAYKTYVRPAMEYGGEVFCTASHNCLRKLDKVQNAALHVITGGAKSTPIAAMEPQAGVDPLQYRREKMVLKFWE